MARNYARKFVDEQVMRSAIFCPHPLLIYVIGTTAGASPIAFDLGPIEVGKARRTGEIASLSAKPLQLGESCAPRSEDFSRHFFSLCAALMPPN